MIDDLLKVGDEVTITIPKENRDWGYNPCPDGTKATVLGFSEIYYGRINNCCLKPGVYVNRAWVKLLFDVSAASFVGVDHGPHHTEYSGRLELTDKDEYERRLAEFRKMQEENPNNWRREEFIRELPETPFWEGDKVRVRARLALTVVTGEMPPEQDPTIFTVIGINFHQLDETIMGKNYPAYNISDKLGSGWHTSASEDDMELVERGNVWKFYHNEPLHFTDIKEEASFFLMLGHYDEARNPKTGYYSWTKEEVLEAIQNGIAHSFSLGRGIFEFIWDPPTRITAYKFRNEELGKRIAQATLSGFGLVPTN